MSTVNYFGLLLWKNWLLLKRKKILTFFEIVLPIFFAGTRLLLRLSTYKYLTFDPEIYSGNLEKATVFHKYELLLLADLRFSF